jgi:hypothetical protein
MNQSKSSLVFYIAPALIVIFFILAFPFKNWLGIRSMRIKQKKWMEWSKEKPSYEQYINLHNQSIDKPSCDYCMNTIIYPSLEMVIALDPIYGFITNKYDHYAYFRSHICSRCNSELFRTMQIGK